MTAASARQRPFSYRLRRHVPWRTVGLYLFTFWVVLTLNFLIPRLMPGDPLQALLDPNSGQFVHDEEARQQIVAYYGLDEPLGRQYLGYLRDLLGGNLGQSIFLKQPVAAVIAARLPWTLLLTLPSLLLASAISLILGTHAGWVRGSFADRALLIVLVFIWNMPVFFVGLLLLLLFGVHWQLLPISGALTRFQQYDSIIDKALDVGKHLLLPMSALTLSMIGGRFLLMRNTMVSVLGQEYMVVARAKGLSPQTIKYRHGMRNAMLPFFTLFSTQVGLAVTGSIFIEALFAYPGMGQMMYVAVESRDYPLLQGAFLVVAISVLVANVAADLLYVRLDPRVEVQ